MQYTMADVCATRSLALAAFFLAVCVGVHADQEETETRTIVVIVNRDNPMDEISALELKRIFLKQRTFWGTGRRSIPIHQSETTAIRKRFSPLVLGKNVEEMKRYWMRQTMTGRARPPVVLNSAAVVKQYVRKIEGGVAYIFADEVDESIKVIKVRDLPELYPPDEPSGAPDTKDPGEDPAPKPPNEEKKPESTP